MEPRKPNASSGHKLGQLIGDWYEEHFVFPLLKEAANQLDLFTDSRFTTRDFSVRDAKIIWDDLDGNSVDYDFVLELGGTEKVRGIPVAFFECFWRRGSRHSKDKARDDSGKLMPMRDTYPTARFLGIVSAGDFTKPAISLVKSRDIDLFYVTKDKIVKAFQNCGLVVDYPDKLQEEQKAEIVATFEGKFDEATKTNVAEELKSLLTNSTTKSYIDRVKASIGSLPQEIRFILCQNSVPIAFDSIQLASQFLETPDFKMTAPIESYLYQISYADGSEFEKTVDSLESLRELHDQIVALTTHMEKIQ